METEIATNNNKSLKSSTTAIASTSNNNNNNLKENNNNGKKEKEQRDRGVQENGHGKMDGGAAGKANVEKKPIRLSSPVGGQPINWHWSEKEKNNIGIEVIELVKFACFHYPELEIPSLKSKLEIVDHTNYDQVRSLAKKFNKAVREKTQNPKENPSKPRHKEFFHQILTRCYNRAVENEKALNKHYEAFSSQTYGETSYERMQMIIEELKPDSKDVFVDLGSGVGQLVVHMAGMTSVQKAVGIEISPLPSKFGRKLETEFKKWMNWFALPFQPFELKQGDFLSEEHRKLIIEEATIIFINNYAFKSDLETRIKRELLSDLRDGTRIISTKEYVSVNKQNAAITDRQLSDISVITDVTEMKPCPNPCSWTSAYVPYYLHTINRAKLENYFLQLRNPSLRAKSSDTGSRRSSTPNSKASNSRESSVGRNMRDKSSENCRINGSGEDAWSVRYGPTTRRKWNEYVNDLEMQKKKKRGGGQKTSSASSSENASTGTSTPAPTSGSSNSQLTNSSTNSSEMATTTTTTANVGQATSVAATPTDAIPSIETEKEENRAAILVEKEIEMATIPSIEPAEHKHQMMEENGTINPLLEMKTIEFPSTIAGTSSNQNQSTPATVTVPLESNREIASPKFEPISPVKQQSSSTKRASTKRSYERKDRSATTSSMGGTGRGRPRKTDKVGSHTTPKLPRLSDDARDGIELMHQMTCAVQSGKPMDTASILADMANQNNTKMCLSGSGASMKNTLMDISPPFPNLENTAAGPSTSTSSSAIRHQNQPDLDVQKQQYSSKYPGLNKFIDGFRRVYENFFDEFYSTNQQKSSMVKNDDSLHSQQSDPIADQFHNYRTIFDQTPVKRPVDELAEIGSGRIRPREISMNGTAWPSTTGEHGSRISELQKRIQNRRKQIDNKWAEMQNEIVLLDADIDALAAECSQQDETNQHIAHQQQLQQQQLVQQQHQQQLIAAAQAQLAAAAAQAQEQQSVAAAAATVVQQAQAAQQVNQAAATVSNQLELMINEMREHYNRQLAAQHLLNQISSLGLLNVIAPQEIAALQNIANGNTMNLNGVHQMSPVAAAAAAIMHSPVASSTQPTLPNSLQQLCSSGAQQQIQNQIENNGQSVQNFLAALDTMNNKNGPKGTSNVNGTVNDTNISANVTAVAAELAHTANNHGLNYANAVNTQPSVHSLSLHQVSQNFSCPQTIPSSSASAEITSQIARESTVAEVVAEVAALPGTRKPFKPRPPRTGGGNKRNGQNAQKQQQQQTMEDPKKQEEIERQIQDIVAKALEVDSAAKSAEKDRKSRSGEKRTSREKTIGNGGLPLNTSSSSLPTTSSSLCSMADINKSPLIATVQPLPARAPPPNSIEYQVKAENAIMQNFLSTAQKQLAQQQAASILQNGGGMTVAINPSNNITPCGTPNSHHQPSTPATILDGKRTPLSGNNNNLGNSTIDFRQAMATLTPTVQSPSIGIGGIHQQPQHFTFTPSSVSLAIQGMASNTFSSPSTGLQISASKLIQTPPTSSPSAKPVTGVGTFLHPGESCSPPFISLNLPPNTCALGPPPTNVVVKVESKVPAPGSGGGGHAGLP